MNCHHYPICARNLVVRLHGIHEVVSTNKRVLSLSLSLSLSVSLSLSLSIHWNIRKHNSKIEGNAPNFKDRLKLHTGNGRQWEAIRNNTDLLTAITIENYQMNVEEKYREAPKSLAYSSNNQTIAIYFLCIEYLAKVGLS